MAAFKDASVLLIKMREPGGGGGEKGKSFESSLAHFEQFLGRLAKEKTEYAFEIAVPHVGEEINFYLVVHGAFREKATRAVWSLWPDASVETMPDDVGVFNPEGVIAAAFIKQKEPPHLPVRTYREMDADPFAHVLDAFGKINKVGEGAALQLVVRPAPSGTAKAIAREGGKPLFYANVRLLASAGSPFRANDILDEIAAGFGQFGGSGLNEFRVAKQRNPDGLIHAFMHRDFVADESMTLSAPELASIFHWPVASLASSRVKWLTAREAPLPDNLPQKGLFLGEAVFRNEAKPVCLADNDRQKHLYVVGDSDVDRSALFGHLAIEDIRAGRGVALIDQDGDLAERVLRAVPASRKKDVVYLNLGDPLHPLGLNILEYDGHHPEEKAFIIEEVQRMFHKLFPPETIGPRFGEYVRNALALLLERAAEEPVTLMDISRLFTDTYFRWHKLERAQDSSAAAFWKKEAARAGEKGSLSRIAPYVTSKFAELASNEYLRPVIGHAASFDMREALDAGKIILIDLSRRKVGAMADLVGMIAVAKIHMAMRARAALATTRAERGINLYLNDFQEYTTDSLAGLLRDASKAGLSLALSHRFLGQLTETVKRAISENIGSVVAFRVGPQDAGFFAKQFAPFDERDLTHLENLNAYAKILVNGKPSEPFKLRIIPSTP